MDEKAFQRYLATGDYTPSAVPAEDMSLAEHDARWHPNGYKEGDRCLFRANLDKGDKGDADVANATPKEGGISGIFTGSSADYSKPSVMYIGSGEGSQVYGWGLYGSNVRGVAEGYANPELDETHEGILINNVISALVEAGVDERKAETFADALQENYSFPGRLLRSLKTEHGASSPEVQEFKKYEPILRKVYKEDGTPFDIGSTVYEQTWFTNRAPGDESHLLKWYEDSSSSFVGTSRMSSLRDFLRYGDIEENNKKKLREVVKKLESNAPVEGHEIYEAVAYAFGNGINKEAPRKASEWFAAHGIDGIKYPVDSFGGKTIKDGNKDGWNYVSFSDDNIRVDRKWRDGEEVDDAVRTKIERYLALDASPIDPDFESKHPRGNSGNKGQFRKSEKTLAKLDEVDASVRPASTPQSGGKVSPAEDAAYLAAVKNGDIATAQRMVREAAARAMPNTKVVDENGLPKVVWHAGSFVSNGETIPNGPMHFGTRKAAIGRIDPESEYFREKEFEKFTPSKGVNIGAYFLDIKNPAYTEDRVSDPEFDKENGIDTLLHDDVHEGYDGNVYMNNVEDPGSTSWVAYSPSQIKSADPVTYDDEGKVIPLSKRFDYTNSDIRY